MRAAPRVASRTPRPRPQVFQWNPILGARRAAVVRTTQARLTPRSGGQLRGQRTLDSLKPADREGEWARPSVGTWSSGSPRGWLPRYPPNTGRPQPPFRRTRQERHEEVDHLGIGLPNRSEPAMGVDRRGVWVPTLVPLVEHSADGPLRGTIGRHDGHLGEEALSGPAARQGQASGYGGNRPIVLRPVRSRGRTGGQDPGRDGTRAANICTGHRSGNFRGLGDLELDRQERGHRTWDASLPRPRGQLESALGERNRGVLA